MANIMTNQERNARKSRKVKEIVENSEKDFSIDKISLGVYSLGLSHILNTAPIKGKILSSKDMSKLLKDEASGEHSFSDKSNIQGAQHHEMDAEFDKAVTAITSAADTAYHMTLELGEDLARIAAMRERIDRQNADNAKALKALLEGA